MRKSIASFLLLCLGIVCGISAALSSFLFVSYKTEESERVVPILVNSGVVAQSYYGTASAPFASYRSLPEALEDANSKAAAGSDVNVYLVPGIGDVVVSDSNLVVESGVSLYLPYDGKKWDRDDTGDLETDLGAIKGTDFADKNAAGVAANRKNHLVLLNSTLTVESGAALYVGGLFRTKGVCSSYSEITLDSSSSILVEGSFTNYGYVKTAEEGSPAVSSLRKAEAEEGESQPEVRIVSGGSVHTYISVYDSLSNSLLVSLNSAGVCPVNAFDFPALQVPFAFESGSTLTAQMRMLLSISGMQQGVDNATSVIAPSGQQSLFNLTSGEIVLEYQPEVRGFTNADSSQTQIDLRGNLSMGYLYVELPASQKLDTSSMFFPFSYKLAVSVKDGATFSTSQDAKLLPGSSFRIEKGGTFDLSGNLIVYPSSLVSGIIPNYPSGYDDASFVNNGTLLVRQGGGLGGEVATESIDGTATIDVRECSQASLTVSSKEGTSGQAVSVSSTAVFRLVEEETTTFPTMLIKAGVLIASYSQQEGETVLPCWSDGYLKSFTLTVIAENPNNYEHPTLAYQIIRYDLDGNTIYITPQGTSVSDLGTFEYTLAEGEKYQIISSNRALSTDFVDDGGNVLSPSFVSGTIYTVESDVNVRIEAGEGILVRFSCDPESGTSGGVQTVSESATENGSFMSIFTATGATSSDVVVRKGFYVIYRWDSGKFDSTKCDLDERIYTWNSLVAVGDIDTYCANHSDFTYETQNAADASQGFIMTGRYIVSQPILVEQEMQMHIRLIYDGEPDDIGGESTGGGGGGCVVEGTLVTMADGTRKPIEEVRPGEMLLAFDHSSGELVPAPVLFVDGEEPRLRTVTYLRFDDGTELGIVDEHGLFDRGSNEYVYIHPDDASSYVDHEFYKEDGSWARLLSVRNVEENVRVYDLPTAVHLNYFTEGMLGMPGGIAGLFNIFELNPDMTVNEEKKAADIAEYGLFEYEEFAPYMSETVFEALPVKYLKVSIGKGLMTYDDIERLLARYGPMLPKENA